MLFRAIISVLFLQFSNFDEVNEQYQSEEAKGISMPLKLHSQSQGWCLREAVG